MSIEKEIQLFEEWCDIFGLPTDEVDGEYTDPRTTAAFLSWYEVLNREGYKLVPVEMSWQKADELASKEWDKNKSTFCVDNRDMSTLQVEEFRLRWCKNKAYQIMSDYKAMIGACDEH